MNAHRRVLGLVLLLVAILLLSSCAPQKASPQPALLPTPTSAGEASATVAPGVTVSSAEAANPCGLPPIVAPTPAPDPGYAALDPSTGLHVTGKMQVIPLATYRLRVTGKVEQPLELTYDQLRCLPKVQASPVLTCPGFFVDKFTWAGTPIAEVLALAKVQAGAKTVAFLSADGYTTYLPLDKALDRANFLAYEWEGQPLPVLHGFPLRVVIPGAEGNQWNKWVIEIQVK